MPALVETYINQLIRHDWSYDYSDDYSAWKKGLAERNALSALQKQVDPDFTIWNKHAPASYRITITG